MDQLDEENAFRILKLVWFIVQYLNLQDFGHLRIGDETGVRSSLCRVFLEEPEMPIHVFICFCYG